MGKIADMVAKMMGEGRRSADIVAAVAKAEDAGMLPAVAIVGAWEEFWQLYPHKVGKPVAERAFAKAMNSRGVTGTMIIAGLQRYIQNKPMDHSWLNPSTFLNQERWNDQPAKVENKARGLDHFARAIAAEEEANGGNGYFGADANDLDDDRGFPRIGSGRH